MSSHVDELADRRRRKQEVKAFAHRLQVALHGTLMEAYQGLDPAERARREVAHARYLQESAAWWEELQLLYLERDRWADDGGREP